MRGVREVRAMCEDGRLYDVVADASSFGADATGAWKDARRDLRRGRVIRRRRL